MVSGQGTSYYKDDSVDCNSVIQTIRNIVSDITTWLLVASIVGAFITIVTFLILRNLRTFSIKLIMYLCICIMFGYIGVNIQNLHWITSRRWACIIIAFWTHYFLLADFCWTFCIAYNFYQMIVKRNREVQLLEKWYHLGAWGCPAVIILVVGLCFEYGSLPGVCGPDVCYITNANATFGAFFVPGIVIITINVILFFLIGREIQETLAGAPKTDQRDRKQEFRVYLSIFISIGVSWIFGYIEASIPQKHVQLIFFIIFSFITPAQGILIFFTQCVNQKVLSRYCELFGKIPYCGCWNTLGERLQRSTASTTASRSAQSRSANSSMSRS